ncbi:unnamed protein product [Pleuronectes platessa]|uniref:Uncharacterized protein n=1 Tax=Pleuronectes platessa TaxID=8262 RepID=A0A9N7UNX2_PLEPL|nr:unnamed protein product [Pleuronectes platessa]
MGEFTHLLIYHCFTGRQGAAVGWRDRMGFDLQLLHVFHFWSNDLSPGAEAALTVPHTPSLSLKLSIIPGEIRLILRSPTRSWSPPCSGTAPPRLEVRMMETQGMERRRGAWAAAWADAGAELGRSYRLHSSPQTGPAGGRPTGSSAEN